ncbi:MAG: ATP-binding protein, partial [Acetobacteraceae bacterium]|nr:ATP-binding protein [Acetobacteraceae bacterium]
MSHVTPVLHMVCGKVASGKSTLCAELARAPSVLVITMDHWTSKLYRDELKTIDDLVCLLPRLRAAMGPHLVELLRAGFSVVLDWPANTVKSRAWMRGVFEAAGASHKLHLLDVPDEICLQRLSARNTGGTHEYRVSQAEFEQLSRYFEPPTPAEG